MRFLVAESREGGQGGGQGSASGAPAVLGYVLATVLGPEGEIADIAVAPEARGRGIGGILLDEMLAMLGGEGVRTVYLEVRESNAAARRLYESRSFGPVGRRRGYYQHPVEDALVLRREIGPA
jgi:ribosomal-protein-alanine N-acetyltransferase